MDSERAAGEAVAAAFHPEPEPIPDQWLVALAPATHYCYEWREYFIQWPNATRLRVGNVWQAPALPGFFRLQFENQLGLTVLQPFHGDQPLAEPLRLEVISPKFGQPESHVRFLRTLLHDLFARAARLPFSFSGPTSRGVAEALQPPSPLFVYHFLLHYGPQLRQALECVRASPHRLLVDHPTYLPIGQASEADPAILMDILHSPQRWARAGEFRLAQRLHGFAPTHVWQRRPDETLDTPENRFVLAFLHQLVAAAETLTSERWWGAVAEDRRRAIVTLTSQARQALAWSMFREVGIMTRMPLNSQVLLRQEGYRDLRDLYWRFHQARRPLFEALRRSIELRDIATLYEQWCFFALVEEIGQQLGVTPQVELATSDEYGLHWQARAHFRNGEELVYNEGRQGYSLWLRPDFVWKRPGHSDVVLDAKFRLRREDVDVASDVPAMAGAQATDLYKMHTYRDALSVRAAVAVYPGDENVFYDRATMQRQGITLADVLLGEHAGVGALAFKPQPSNAAA